jgi:hypothetical protein
VSAFTILSAKVHMRDSRRNREAGKVSTGCIIAIVAAVVLGIVVVLVAVFALGLGVYIWGAAAPKSGSPGSPTAGSPSKPSSAGKAYESPEPTPAQSGSVAGGKSIVWTDQGLQFTVPQSWTKQTEEKTTLTWSAPGYRGFLIVSVSPLGNDFPVDTSLDAFYTQALQQQQSGEVRVVKRVALDGVNGIMFYENAPSNPDDVQRLQWLGYRNYLGQTEMVSIMITSKGKDAAQLEDTAYGILYSTKIPH